jgi:hypothetical protein
MTLPGCKRSPALQHYAARTVENIAALGGSWAAALADGLLIGNLVSLWRGARCAGRVVCCAAPECCSCRELHERLFHSAQPHTGIRLMDALCHGREVPSAPGACALQRGTRRQMPAPVCATSPRNIPARHRSEALREAAAGALACVLHHSPPQLAALVSKYGARMLVAGAAANRYNHATEPSRKTGHRPQHTSSCFACAHATALSLS